MQGVGGYAFLCLLLLLVYQYATRLYVLIIVLFLGFVSYDQAQSASIAINTLNGYAIGTKRLKVEHKKPKRQ